jgi:acyl-CoA reductase-like NAD-dependent aldehyde dehydrogenase
MGSPRFPEPPPSIPATPIAELDAVVARLGPNKDKWANLGIPERIALLEKCAPLVQEQAKAWAVSGCRAKGIDPDSPLAGEEWLAGPYQVARNIRVYIDALKAGGQPAPKKLTKATSGHTVAHVYPMSQKDALFFPGVTAEVWLEKGKPVTQGAIYREKGPKKGKLSLVLGAGNISCIGPMDVLNKLIIENEICVLKMNPVNDYAGPFIKASFQPLVDAGYFDVVYGGAEVGKHLTHHDGIDTIHITGSATTHDFIIWGDTPDEIAKNKAAKTPKLKKPISSELGAVTPLLVVPGPWTDADIAFQAEHVAAMVAHNASFDCNAIKVIVVAKGWPLRQKFLDAVAKALSEVPSRKAYYPGALDRYQKFVNHYPQSKVLSETGPEIVPWTMIPEVPLKEGEYALSNEAFCGVLAVTNIDTDDASTFLELAVKAANDDIWGSLSCAMLVHPETERAHKAEVERALADLKYGGIGYNIWPGILFGLVNTTWGAYPGHPLEDVRSGRGVVHNALFFDHPEKSIVRGAFRMNPKPIWFPSHKTLREMGEKLVRLEYNYGYLSAPSVIFSALRG